MDADELRSDPDDQAARGLSPDEQREERDRETEATEETKYDRAVERESEERERLAERLREDPELGGEGGLP